MNEQKILDTLEYIKDICKNSACAKCPLSSENASRCVLRDYDPCNWEFNDLPPKKWSAFRTEDME